MNCLFADEGFFFGHGSENSSEHAHVSPARQSGCDVDAQIPWPRQFIITPRRRSAKSDQSLTGKRSSLNLQLSSVGNAKTNTGADARLSYPRPGPNTPLHTLQLTWPQFSAPNIDIDEPVSVQRGDEQEGDARRQVLALAASAGLCTLSFYMEPDVNAVQLGPKHVRQPDRYPVVSKCSPRAPACTAAVSEASSQASLATDATPKWAHLWCNTRAQQPMLHSAMKMGDVPAHSPLLLSHNQRSQRTAAGDWLSPLGRKSGRRDNHELTEAASMTSHTDVDASCRAHAPPATGEPAPHEYAALQSTAPPSKRQATPQAREALHKQRQHKAVHATQPRAFAAALASALREASLDTQDPSGDEHDMGGRCDLPVNLSQQQATAVHALLSMSKRHAVDMTRKV